MLLAQGAATDRLVDLARGAMARAYAPYSDFAVGVALRDEAGGLHAGANVENASYPQGQCAETSAIGALVAGGGHRIAEVVVMADTELITPCGGCRQRLRELGDPDTPVHLAGPEGIRRTLTLGDLLPHSFTKERPVTDAADLVRERLPAGAPAPRAALVLGSGLGAVADEVQDAVAIPYAELPGFPVGSVAGHAGRLVVGTLSGVPVAVLQGRAHLYEGVDPAAIAVPVRTVRALGAELILLTNAAGSLRAEVGPGRLMALTDHINMTGRNPLVGPEFVGMGRAYDPELLDRLRRRGGEGRRRPLRGRLRRGPGAELRDGRGDPGVPHPRRRRRGHVDRARDHRRAPLRPARRGGLGDHQPRGGHERRGAQPRGHAPRGRPGRERPRPRAPTLRGGPRMIDPVAVIDLTTLEDDDTPARVRALCEKAQTPRGPVAAVCILPRLAAVAVEALQGSPVKVATVANFPDGAYDPDGAAATAAQAVADGVDEVDVVAPWRSVLQGDDESLARLVAMTSDACGDRTLKVILETGSIPDPLTIRAMADAALDAGAFFLKTSTGKFGPGADLGSARVLLEAVRDNGSGGVKVSGGVRTAEQADDYLRLTSAILGEEAVTPERFRIGASSLLDALLAG